MIPLYHEPPAAHLHILVVDNNEAEAHQALTVIQECGHIADWACDGNEAIEAVYRTPYDLLLIEILLPEISGFDIVTTIRTLPATRGLLPILALSKTADPEDVRACFQVGMSNFLLKPLNKERLLTAIGLYVVHKSNLHQASRDR